jgi:hypothetical protein
MRGCRLRLPPRKALAPILKDEKRKIALRWIAHEPIRQEFPFFEIDAAWTNMTFTVTPPGGQGMTNSSPWRGGPIDKVWLGECGASNYDTGNATYDDLVVPTLSAAQVAPQMPAKQERSSVRQQLQAPLLQARPRAYTLLQVFVAKALAPSFPVPDSWEQMGFWIEGPVQRL